MKGGREEKSTYYGISFPVRLSSVSTGSFANSNNASGTKKLYDKSNICREGKEEHKARGKANKQ